MISQTLNAQQLVDFTSLLILLLLCGGFCLLVTIVIQVLITILDEYSRK